MSATIRRVSFAGSQGGQLAARLDLPAGPPRAFAVLAHCFTCGKDLPAAGRIADGLTRHGIGVLRFDVTGLGESEGDFGGTDVGTNVDDLVLAADWLRAEHRAPQLVVGHSLGGAAALLAADRIPELRAIATIGAPSDTRHLARVFTGVEAEIRAGGRTEVTIADRSFTITAEFLDDLEAHGVEDAARAFDGALLVLHSPVDQVVSVDHAERLYVAARHPKSFVSLDDADHLLTSPADAARVAGVISAWADRYLDRADEGLAPPEPTAQIVVAESTLGPFHNHVVSGRHHLVADEPESVGGSDAGPSPYDFLAAALGTCTSMTLRMYADRKQLSLDRVTVEVSHDQVHADDAVAAGDGQPARSPMVDRFTRVIHLDGDLDDAARTRLLQIADRCPVHRTLHQSSRIETRLA